MQGIYRIRNKLNGKYYVGSSKDIKRRLAEHRWLLESGNDSCILQSAWDKYGKENFEFEIIEEIHGSREDLFREEQMYLDEGFANGILYNISIDAASALSGILSENHPRGMLGKHHTEESKIRIRESNLKTWTSEKRKELGKIISRRWSQERRAEQSRRISGGANPMYGKKHTEEWKRNHAETMARPYPAFYNDKTNEFIPAGVNFYELCQILKVSYYAMYDLKRGSTKQTRDGWRLATSEEIAR